MPEMGLSGLEGGVALTTPSLPLSRAGASRFPPTIPGRTGGKPNRANQVCIPAASDYAAVTIGK